MGWCGCELVSLRGCVGRLGRRGFVVRSWDAGAGKREFRRKTWDFGLKMLIVELG